MIMICLLIVGDVVCKRIGSERRRSERVFGPTSRPTKSNKNNLIIIGCRGDCVFQ